MSTGLISLYLEAKKESGFQWLGKTGSSPLRRQGKSSNVVAGGLPYDSLLFLLSLIGTSTVSTAKTELALQRKWSVLFGATSEDHSALLGTILCL